MKTFRCLKMHIVGTYIIILYHAGMVRYLTISIAVLDITILDSKYSILTF